MVGAHTPETLPQTQGQCLPPYPYEPQKRRALLQFYQDIFGTGVAGHSRLGGRLAPEAHFPREMKPFWNPWIHLEPVSCTLYPPTPHEPLRLRMRPIHGRARHTHAFLPRLRDPEQAVAFLGASFVGILVAGTTSMLW